MPSGLNARRLFPALTLAVLLALLRRAPAAPLLEDAPTDSPAGEPSGEEGEAESSADTLRMRLESLLCTTKRHMKEFSDEFHGQVKYDTLNHYKISSLPAACPRSNFSREACLRRLLQGLLVFTPLLKQVEKEYPGSTIPSEAKYYSSLLIRELEKRARDAPEVTAAMISGQEEQLLRDMNVSTAFHRKMMAHSILYTMHYFLVDCNAVIRKRERNRGGSRAAAPIIFC